MLSERSDGEVSMTQSSSCLSASRCKRRGNEPLPTFVATITSLPLLKCGFVRPNCKSAWLRFFANGADGSRRTCSTRGEFSLQAKEAPKATRAPHRRHILISGLSGKSAVPSPLQQIHRGGHVVHAEILGQRRVLARHGFVHRISDIAVGDMACGRGAQL